MLHYTVTKDGFESIGQRWVQNYPMIPDGRCTFLQADGDELNWLAYHVPECENYVQEHSRVWRWEGADAEKIADLFRQREPKERVYCYRRSSYSP